MASFIDKSGQRQEFALDLTHYKAALDANLTLPQYINQTLDTDAEVHGDAFDQLRASMGMVVREDKAYGIKPSTLKQIFSGEKSMGALVSPSGANALTITGRLMFASTILEMMNSDLYNDYHSYETLWNGLIAQTQSVPTPRVDWPVLNLTAPRASRSAPIAQLATPTSMATISLSDKSARLPVFSIGLEVSHQALENATLDFVGLAVREQMAGEKVALIDEAITKLVAGDLDWGLSALSSENVKSYDSGISSNGVMTQKAWIKWLRQDHKKLTITDIICDLDAYLAIEGRTGRPVVANDRSNSEILNVIPSITNPGIPGEVRFFIVDTAIIGANTLVGIDRSKAIKKWAYAGAAYEAMEDYVMRRSTAFRWDWSEAYTRIVDSAFKVLTLTTS